MNRRPRFGIKRVNAWRQPIGTLDPSIVERARRGDLEAFESIVADRIGAVYRLTLAIVGNEADAADATQETFLIAANRLGDIAPDSERAFLIGTARRVAHTLGRKTLRWQLDENMDQRISNARDAGEEHADVQLCDVALSKMNPELAEAFVLYEIEGLSSPEIAALLEVPLGSVASRLRRAREQFRDAVLRIERSLQRIQRRP